MKKVLLVFAILLAGLFLASCESGQEELQAAYDTLGGVINEPSAITSNFSLPTDLVGGVTAEWSSDQPGVISIGTPADGVVLVTVNRPAFGQPDAEVILSAVLSLEGTSNTMTYTIELTVIAQATQELSINNIADFLAVTDAAYDPSEDEDKTQISLDNVTVFAKGDDSAFIYDGTGITVLMYGESASMEIGAVYNVTGTMEWYYGMWELKEPTFTLQESATPQYPTAEEFTSVQTAINGFVADGLDEYAFGDVTGGNMEPIYATITGTVYMIPEDTSNYNTWIVDTTEVDPSSAVSGTSSTPANAFMVYYHTNDFATLRLYNGQTVTIDVVIHTYRSNNLAFALYYVGGPEGIVAANLSDEQKIQIDADSLSIPASSSEATTLTLPTSGVNGSTIVWSFTDGLDPNNSYVDLATGEATVPAASQVEVGLTATVSFTGQDDIVVDFVIKLGEYPVSTVAEAIALGEGAIVKVVGVVTDITDAGSNGAAYFQDATGGFNLYTGSTLIITDAMLGRTYEIIGEVDLYNGLNELVGFTLEDMVELTGEDALSFEAVDISEMTLDSATLLPYQAQLVDLTGFVTKYALNSAYTSSFNISMINEAGEEIAVRLDRDVPGFADFVAQVVDLPAGSPLDFTDVIVGWYYSPQLLVGSNATIATGEANSEADQAAVASLLLDVPEAGDEVIADLTLPTTGIYGATVVWSSDNAAITTAGVVTRPAEGQPDVNVTLGYTVTVGGTTLTEVTVVVTVLAEVAQAAPELFFSEYIESGGEKALEIYNPTDSTVDLSSYTVELYSNANSTVQSSLTLTGTLASGEVYVISYGPDTQALIDATDAENAVANFNGNDASVLKKDGAIIDIIGVVAAGVYFAEDVTLVRNASIVAGNTTYTPAEWSSQATEFTHIGSHTCDLPAA